MGGAAVRGSFAGFYVKIHVEISPLPYRLPPVANLMSNAGELCLADLSASCVSQTCLRA